MNARLHRALRPAALLVTALAVAGPAPAASAPGAGGTGTVAATPAAGEMPSFAGTWRLDPAKSTLPGRRGGAAGMRGGMSPREGGGMAPGGARRGDRSRRGAGAMPRILHIAQGGGVITLSDSAGTALEEIVYEDPAPPSRGVRRLGGEWDGARLVALGEAPMGGVLTQHYSLEDGGRTLKIRTRVEPEGDRPTLEFVRVYRRETAR